MHVSSPYHTAESSRSGFRGFMQRHALLSYFVMAYSFSWIAWLPYVLSQDGLGLWSFQPDQLVTLLAMLPGAFLGPCLSGFVMTAVTEGKPGVRRLLHRLLLRDIGWQWYLVVIFGIPLVITAVYFLLPGGVTAFHPDLLQIIWLFMFLFFVEIFIGGLAEEPGWRGFALPRLQRKLSPLLASVILGILWQCWRLPLYLTSWGNGADFLMIGVATFESIFFTIIITWVFNYTRESVFIVMLLHASFDAFRVIALTSIFSAQWIQQNAETGVLVGVGMTALVLAVATRSRLGYQPENLSARATSKINGGSA
ncbi:CPBP family intramembrane metalloprotease [Ktedonosporobacter rubrisoli]|uniref:CPBP family intramembrane metalloprotease n=1 Tax=Ktedonosporobacter rubrisoli TaxID=2509675 RepID=A0A4P6JJN3_KTERU|nr:CPBP family intramembrane glutamic endopeptidase [Ktedonosporobacter rubrisoli]QBD75334.1 CPBP family intramembrane metalloprotease [Ktedonosporobacter rubrisoli]